MSGRSEPASDPQPGDRIGPYRILGRIGGGGSGTVFRAVDERDGSSVAVKLLHEMLLADPTWLRRFGREIEIAQRVRHPNLLPILDAGEVDGRPFLVQPFVSAGSLADELAFSGPLDARRLAACVRDVAAGLDALHAAGVIHRDVKPSNVLFDPRGLAMLSDFGLARARDSSALTRAGEVLGSPDYVPPEVVMGAAASVASDVYSFGCLVYEVVTGHGPFAGRGMLDLARAHLTEIPADPLAERGDLPVAFGPVVVLALAKDPASRPSSAGAYAAMLLLVLDGAA